ncbi:hypothetical protein ACHAXS_006037 [Conticribra weissflogii]
MITTIYDCIAHCIQPRRMPYNCDFLFFPFHQKVHKEVITSVKSQREGTPTSSVREADVGCKPTILILPLSLHEQPISLSFRNYRVNDPQM